MRRLKSCLAATLLAAAPAGAFGFPDSPSLGEVRRAGEACTRGVIEAAQAQGQAIDADAVRMQQQIGGGSGRDVEFTFRVETPGFAARGDCLAVGRGNNYRVGRLNLRPAG